MFTLLKAPLKALLVCASSPLNTSFFSFIHAQIILEGGRMADPDLEGTPEILALFV